MRTLIDVSLGAHGSPTEVKARIADQVRALASTQEQAPIASAINTFVASKLEGVSEDDTLSVQASVAIVVSDAPATVVAKREAEKEAHGKEIRQREATIADRDKQIEALRAELAAAKTPTPSVE